MTHMKRLVAPNTWPIARKVDKFVPRAKPTGTKFKYALPISLVLREIINVCKNHKEVNYLVSHKLVSVNGNRIKDPKNTVGLFQVLKVKDELYRVSMSKSGKLNLIKTDNTIQISQVMNKNKIKTNVNQINLFDGYNILVDDNTSKSISTRDTIVIQDNKITDILKFEKGAMVFLFDGSNRGIKGVVNTIEDQFVIINYGGKTVKTPKRYCYVISKPNEIQIIKTE